MKLFLMLIATICSLQFANAKDIVLTTKNVCSLEGKVNGSSMFALKACLVDKVLSRRGGKYPIYLYLRSPGGDIYNGLRFIAFAKTFKNVHTITEFSASMAAAIAQGIPGKRYVTEGGVFMFHRAKGRFSGQFENGEVEARLKLWKQIVGKMELMQADRIGITLRDYKEKRMNEWYVMGEDSVEQNVADEVVGVACSKRLLRDTFEITYNTLFGSQTVKYSRCPLVN